MWFEDIVYGIIIIWFGLSILVATLGGIKKIAVWLQNRFFSPSITMKELIPIVRKRLIGYGEKAPFGDQYISEEPTYKQIGWAHKLDTMSQILSEYGESCALEKTIHLEPMTKQFNAEIAAIQEVLVERLGSDIHGRRGSAILAWENIALPIREFGGNIIRIFPSNDIYGKPIYDVMPCDRFLRWVGQSLVNGSMARIKNEKWIASLAGACMILAAICLWFILHQPTI